MMKYDKELADVIEATIIYVLKTNKPTIKVLRNELVSSIINAGYAKITE